MQARPVRKRQTFLVTHLPGSGENQWCLGVRSCLPLRGSPGFAPGSLWTFPLETSPASAPQDKASLVCCQSKCCGSDLIADFRFASVSARTKPMPDHSALMLLTRQHLVIEFSLTTCGGNPTTREVIHGAQSFGLAPTGVLSLSSWIRCLKVPSWSITFPPKVSAGFAGSQTRWPSHCGSERRELHQRQTSGVLLSTVFSSV